MKGQFVDKHTPNKQVVMADMYHKASKYVHQTDVVILPSAFPFRPLRRLFRYGLVGKKSKIFGYELSRETAMQWMMSSEDDKTSRSNIYVIEKRLKAAGYPFSIDKMLKFKVGNVSNAPAQVFMDLDFCTSWVTSRDIAKGMKDPNSAVRIMMATIQKQKKAFPNEYKVLLGTISLRGATGGKFVANAYLNGLVQYATGDKIIHIDDDYEAYGRGTKISTKGCLHKNGKTYHAYKHNVVTTTDGNVSLSMYTYTDSTPMMSFILTYK